MKKLSILVAVAGLCFANLNTQAQGLYAGLGVGYGFPSCVQANPYPASSTTLGTSSGSSGTVTGSSYSGGSGVSVGVHIGYMLNKNVGIELGIADKFTNSIATTQTQAYQADTLGGASAGSGTGTTTIKAGLFSLTPSLRIMAGDDGDKMRPYMVTGLVIGFPTYVVDNTMSGTEDFGSNVGILSQTSTDTYSGGMIIGFHGALGIMYSLSDKIGIFGEVACNLQNWSPGKDIYTSTETETGLGGTLTDNTTTTTTYGSSISTNTNAKNGTEVFNGTASTFNYNGGNGTSSETITTTATTENVSETNSRNANNTYLPFSSWGITIGVHFNFGGGSSAK